MPEYKYIAKSETKDDKITGRISAKNKSELARNLRKKRIFLIEAEEIESGKKDISFFSFSKKVSLLERILFTRNLKVMLSGGLSFAKSLQILVEQTKNKRFKLIILDIRNEVMKGNNFSYALDKHSEVFSEVFRNMIRISEEAGTMEGTLETLTAQLESEYELKSKIKGALIYPSVIISAMMGIGIIFLTVFIPKLATTFESMGAELPIFTKIIIETGTFLSERWYLIPVIIFLMIYVFKGLLKTKGGKAMIDAFLLKAPIVSILVKKNNAAYVIKTMAALLVSGVPIIKSMEILSRSISNIYFVQSITDSIKVIEKGGRLSNALLPFSHLYGLMTVQMLEVGEETGKTTEMLFKTAEFLEEEVTNLTKNLTAVLEPVLMIFIGAAIGIFALAVIMPIYSMLEYI